jgi:hypothetical protein
MTRIYTPEQKAAKAAYQRQWAARPEVKAARAAQAKIREETNKEKRQAQHRAWYEAHKERELARGKAYRETRRSVYAEYQRKYRYGLTTPRFDAMLIAQSGRCGACSEPMLNLNVDHCHKTGQVRELLCGSCNRTAGHLGDDVARLRLLADYLERHAA